MTFGSDPRAYCRSVPRPVRLEGPEHISWHGFLYDGKPNGTSASFWSVFFWAIGNIARSPWVLCSRRLRLPNWSYHRWFQGPICRRILPPCRSWLDQYGCGWSLLWSWKYSTVEPFLFFLVVVRKYMLTRLACTECNVKGIMHHSCAYWFGGRRTG